MRINPKSFGLIVGGAAVAASAVLAVGHGGGATPAGAVTVEAKNASNATAANTYTTPSANVRSGGSDSGATATPAGG
jgi:hypothetical protein